jgi:hypothetical protein
MLDWMTLFMHLVHLTARQLYSSIGT